MTFFLHLLLSLALAAASYGHHGKYALPDPRVTPGQVAITDQEKVCSVTWGKDQRHVTQSMKKQVCSAYGVKSGCPGKGYEIDHLVSRELGGADALPNLWPQPAPDFHDKDVLENRLHKMVCAGQISLRQAQQEIAGDWVSSYQRRIGPLPN